VYPNGKADVNEFQAAGGLSIVIRELIDAGLLHDDVTTVMGKGLRRHAQEPFLQDMDGKMRLVWRDGAAASLDTNIVRGVAEPFSPDGGLRVLDGNLGRSVIKVSAVKPEHRVVEAPARVFHAQDDLIHAFKAGELERDFIAVLPYQGPAANGMPELHKLTPTLSVLQERGFKVALVTDGRMSGASGKVPAAIHVTPEALNGGPLARVRDGDIMVLDAEAGTLSVRVPEAEWNARQVSTPELAHYHAGVGRDLFSGFRRNVSAAEEGACTLFVSAGA
jgi:phosphogluconate dehydratase